MKKTLLLIFILSLAFKVNSQVNPSTASVPFLLIPTDARSAGMGDIGVGTSSDVNSLFHNPAKIAFNKNQLSLGVNYTPWLRNLTDDVFIGSLSAVGRINEKSAWGADIKYFSLGEIELTDISSSSLGIIKPNEFALSGYYALKLSDEFSMGVGLRYINSSIGVDDDFDSGSTVAVDVSGYYHSPQKDYGSFDGRFRLGLNLTNLGPKINYNSGEKNAIPTNLKIGGGFDFILNDKNTIGVNTEFKKLLISSDSPDIGIALGGEYTYNNAFAFRTGYYTESEESGGRKYLTLGAGFKTNALSFDLSYLVNASEVNNPLENTLRFSVSLDLGKTYENN